MIPQKEERLPTNDSALICQYRSEAEYPLHWHFHDSWELTKIFKGMGIRMIGSDISPYNEGELILLPPGLPHSWNSESKENKALFLQFREEAFESLLNLAEMRAVKALLNHGTGAILFHQAVSGYVGIMLDRLSRTDGINRIFLFLEILKILSEEQNYTRISIRDASDYSPKESRRMTRILQYVDQRYKEKITIEEMASLASMSKNAFCRYFKNTCYMTFMDYVVRKRISAACHRLIESEDSITAIAFDSGFVNMSNFNRQFKKIMNQTPSAFRKVHK